MKKLVVLTGLLLLGSPLFLNAKMLKILYPHAQTICVEGSLCPILWQSELSDPVCIELLIGGHPKGILNNCSTPAQMERYYWHVSPGFVSGFGVPGSHDVYVVIYPKNRFDLRSVSAAFTVMKPGADPKSF